MSQSPILDEISTMCAVPMTFRESSLSGEVIVLPIVEYNVHNRISNQANHLQDFSPVAQLISFGVMIRLCVLCTSIGKDFYLGLCNLMHWKPLGREVLTVGKKGDQCDVLAQPHSPCNSQHPIPLA